MNDYFEKIKYFMLDDIKGKKDLRILEFGVRDGISTKLFVEHCEQNGGMVYSVDINDCSKVLKSDKWKFIQSRDDNFDFLDRILPELFDLIYLDSFHNAKHIEKIFYHFFIKLKKNCFFYLDDISWLPYSKFNYRDNFNCEINNQETFQKLLEILNPNYDIIDVYFSFKSSGMAKIYKKSEKIIFKPKIIKSRKYSIKNIIRKITSN